MNSKNAISRTYIEDKILSIRGYRVMLDSDLAVMYDTTTGRLNERVRRNLKRFPPDFMFQLTRTECCNLISQSAISSSRWGGRRKSPLAFTQEGVAMLSGVLNVPRAIRVNIAIMRAFVKLRETLLLRKDLALRLERLENKIETHDEQIISVFAAIRELMNPPEKPKKQIGFTAKEKRARYLSAVV